MNSYNEIISAESVMLYLIKDNFNLNGQLLTAYSIVFNQPTTNKEINLTINLPDYFENLLEKLRNS